MGHRILYIPKLSSVFYPKYGLLYNWYAATDTREIAPAGWRVATGDLSSPPYSGDYGNLMQYLDPAVSGFFSYIADDKLREADFNYWNTIGTNDVGFNGRGSGQRDSSGFKNLKSQSLFWASSTWDRTDTKSISLLDLTQFTSPIRFSGSSTAPYYSGLSIRLVKNSTTLIHGQTGIMVGNDGKIYRTICINGVEWLADNLSETRFRNGDIIPWYGANQTNYFTNMEWINLTAAGVCAYDNDEMNVAENFTFPTI